MGFGLGQALNLSTVYEGRFLEYSGHPDLRAPRARAFGT